MKIYLVNLSSASRAEVASVVGAINLQLRADVQPYWSVNCRLQLHSGQQLPTDATDRDREVIFLQNEASIDGAVGYHDRFEGISVGYVFLDVAKSLGEPWSVALSHETLEMLGDPYCTLLATGPHPNPKCKYHVGHWYELCDAVQSNTYLRNGHLVSNFVLPQYFAVDEKTACVDFMNTGLRSSGVNPGGYVGFYDPTTGRHDTYVRYRDNVAKRRLAVKNKMLPNRRGVKFSTRL